MNMRIVVAGATLFASIVGANALARHVETVPREATFGAQYVIYELARIKSPSVRAVRDRCGSACNSGGGDIEAVIGLLGIGGQPTTDSLLNLLAVQLDAGGSEERSCQIAKRGKGLVLALKRFSSTKASSWCSEAFAQLRKRELSDVKDISVRQVCRPTAEVETDRKEWIESLESGRDLFAESGPC